MRDTFLSRRDSKSTIAKKTILNLCIKYGNHSIAELSKKLNMSVPTVTKLISELIQEGFMIDLGKLGTSGGRRPSIFGLNPDAGCFVGVNIGDKSVSIAITDFNGKVLVSDSNIEFEMTADETSLHRICNTIRMYFSAHAMDWGQILACGISLTGRVNPFKGFSSSYSFDVEHSIVGILSEDLGVPVVIENDSRAMTYGEFLDGAVKKEKNVIFINVSSGLGMGVILNGSLYYGKSGYSGEFGHFPLFNNDVICRCGKVGCLETMASGWALRRKIVEQLNAGRASLLGKKFRAGEEITIDDVLLAVKEEDVLAIEALEEVGNSLGRGIAGLINIFNPELVIIGGTLAKAGDYLMLTVRSTVKKLAQNIVNQDTNIKFSKLGSLAAPIGAAMLSRSKLLGLM